MSGLYDVTRHTGLQRTSGRTVQQSLLRGRRLPDSSCFASRWRPGQHLGLGVPRTVPGQGLVCGSFWGKIPGNRNRGVGRKMEGEMPIQRYVTELNPGSRREPVPPRRDAGRSGPCAAGWPRKCGGGRWQSGPGATHGEHRADAGRTAVTSVAELPLPGTSNKEASQLERLSFRAPGRVDGRSVGTGWPGKRPQAAGKQTPFRGQLQGSRGSPGPTQTGATRQQERELGARSRPQAEQVEPEQGLLLAGLGKERSAPG